MDDTEDDVRYAPKQYGINQGVYGSLNRAKLPFRNMPYPHPHIGYQNVEDDEDEEVNREEEEEEEDDNEDNDVNDFEQNGKSEKYDDVDDDGDGGSDEEDEEGDDDDDKQITSRRTFEIIDQNRHQKKRKMMSLLSSYEFAPRVATPSAVATSAPKPLSAGRNSLSDWTEHETFVLLDAWGGRFVRRGRKSLRSEEWQEVAEKVSQVSKLERSDTQCRNRLDTLKKKYKKEKMKLDGVSGLTSKWVYFEKMDMLLCSLRRQTGLPRRMISGEFTSPRVHLNGANGLDEGRDSPGNSVSVDAEENNSDPLPLNRTNRGDGASFRLLADSIQKFSDIYEKIESSKRQQMLELEKMRMDFHRDLEMQKRQILERTRDEIARIRQGDEANEVSAEDGNR